MKHTREQDVEGIRAPSPNARTLKHLAAPWTIGSENLWVGLSEVDPGSSSNKHSHPNEEVFYVVAGEGEIEVGEESVVVAAGSVVVAPSGEPHRLVNRGSGVLKVLCSVAPAFEREVFESSHNLDSSAS